MRADRQSAQKRDPVLNPLLLLIPHHDIPWLGVVRRCRILASPLSHIVRVAAGFPSLLLLPLSPFPPHLPELPESHPHTPPIRTSSATPPATPSSSPRLLHPYPPSSVIGPKTPTIPAHASPPPLPGHVPPAPHASAPLRKEVRGSNPETRLPAYI